MTRHENRRLWQFGPRLVLVSSALLLLGAPCPTSSIPEQGDIDVTILRAVDTAGSLCPITRVNWEVDPVTVPPRPSGSLVGTTAFNKWNSYSSGTGSTSGGTTQFPVMCTHYETFSALAAGTWSVTGKAVKGNAFTCNKVVTAGGRTAATWIFNVGGTAESCM